MSSWLRSFKQHISGLIHEGKVYVSSKMDILAGSDWQIETIKKIGEADIILLMISSDFMASEYLYNQELKDVKISSILGGATVFNIILRHVRYQGTEFSEFEFLPTDYNPVKSNFWESDDEAFFDIVEELARVIDNKIGNKKEQKYDENKEYYYRIYRKIKRKSPYLKNKKSELELKSHQKRLYIKEEDIITIHKEYKCLEALKDFLSDHYKIESI